MYNSVFLCNGRNLFRLSADNSAIFRSVVPKSSRYCNYKDLSRFYITHNKSTGLYYNKYGDKGGVNPGLSNVRHISVNNLTPPKNLGAYNKLLSCAKLMRVHSPIPVVIFALPVMWSAALALPPVVTLLEVKKIVLMWMGAFFARSAGCCVNDLADRNFDKMVTRTKIRPLASGSIGTKEALVTLAFNSTAALAILFQFDPTTIGLGFLTGLTCGAYPFMKRFISFPQLILGLSSGIGTLMAWTAISGSPIGMAPICIYLTSSLWSTIYDTVYAHQDKNDDKKLGLGSLALKWGDNTKKMCNLVAYNMSVLMAACGYFAQLTEAFYVSVVLSHLWMMREIKKVNLEDPQDCFMFFKKSVVYGSLLLGGILLGKPNLSLNLKCNKSAESNIS